MKGRVSCTAALGAAVACAALCAPALSSQLSFTPQMAARITDIAEREVHSGRSPGLAIGVVEDGRTVYARGFGFANAAQNVRFQPDTESALGGITMQFTAAAILLLAQDGKLQLDDDVTKYVPELGVAKGVTIAELLQQTSGLPEYANAIELAGRAAAPVTLDALFAAANKLAPSDKPGTAYQDNELNYILAGAIVQRVSGVPVSDYLQQHIFLPLVMTRTFLAGDTGIAPDRAVGYTKVRQGFVPARVDDASWMAPVRGLISTVYDVAKWDIEMPILLRVNAVRTMFAPSGASRPAQYAMGWIADQRNGEPLVWYASEVPGYRASNTVLPSEHAAVVVLSNTDGLHGKDVASPQELTQRVLDTIDPPVAAKLDNAIVTRAKQWLRMLADKKIDRTQLTPEFSAYLTDSLVSSENFASLGPVTAFVPLSSTTAPNGNVDYEFLVRYTHGEYRYVFTVAPDGKIDGLQLKRFGTRGS
jgi:D-alanyl-D-alanine carboxypeptidase